jgi:predicted nucleotidyltransferase
MPSRVDSDYDILVITETGEPHELARIASRVLRGRNFALDLLALPKAHIAARMEHSTLLKKIFKEGKVIYAA